MQVGRRSRSRPQAIGTCLTLGACQPLPAPFVQTGSAPAPSSVNGVEYTVFAAPINRGNSVLLINEMDKLQEQGTCEIDLAMNALGGKISTVGAIVAELDRLQAEDVIIFNAYDIHLVASAAGFVFLDAQGRFAAPRSGFLFLAPVMIGSGTFSEEVLRKNADQIDQDKQIFRDVLLARTHLTKSQIDVYMSRTMVLSADDAQHDGIIDIVKSPMAPKSTRTWVIKTKPKALAPAQRTPEHPATPGIGQG